MVKIKKYILPNIALLLILSIFIVSLLNDAKAPVTVSNFAMGSPVSITVYGEKNGEALCEKAIERISFIDKSYLSHTIATSAISTLNKDKSITADKWFGDYLTKCVELSDKCEGFTLFSGELKELWKIEQGGYVPTNNEISATLENLNKTDLKIDSNSLSINNGILDLGALGKGTACEEAVGILKKNGVEKALVTVGGTVGAMGDEPYKIGVRNPFGNQNEYFAVLNVSDCFVSTSGDYEKYFEKDGIRYSHIFDARTGAPVQNDITSVTVVAGNGTVSDFLSTALYIEGAESGIKLAEDFDAQVIIAKKDKSVLVSKGLKDKLTINDNSFSISVIE